MAPGSPLKRPERRGYKGPLREKAVPTAGLAVAVATAALLLLLLLLCAAALRCSPAIGCAQSAGTTLWASGVSVAAEADVAASASASASAGKSDDEGQCDLFDGEWVWSDGGGAGGGYPLYSSVDCPFLDVGFRCADNGRPDASYTKWRWQPSRCHLPRLVGWLVARSLAWIRFDSYHLCSPQLDAGCGLPHPFHLLAC